VKYLQEQKEYLIQLWKQNKYNNRQIADILNDKYRTEYWDSERIRDRIRKYKKKNNIQVTTDKNAVEYKNTVEIHSDGRQTSDKLIKMAEEQSKDVDFLLEKHGYDKRKWVLISARNNIWNVYSKIDKIQTLYSSKITVKPRNDISLEEIQEHFEKFSNKYKSSIHIPTYYNIKGKMLEINIADLHLGKLAWYGDSGENYDYKIAKERFFYVLNDVLTRTKYYQFEKILFVWSNDFFHFDTINTTTTAGTKQDSDLRWQKLYLIGVEMLVEGIDLLSQYAPVETFYIESNHDEMTSYYAINYLYAWYKDNPNIKIDRNPIGRKFIEWGNSLIGFCHGSNISKKNLSGLLPKEAREAWGRTLYHEIHAAHYHSEQKTEENNGTIIRYVSSPTSTDNWHYKSGYIGAVKKAESFIWDREKGLLDILYSPII